MKRIITILLGLTLNASANAADLSGKFYLGLTLGQSATLYNAYFTGFIKNLYSKEPNGMSANLGIVIGRDFGNDWGIEFNGALINYHRYEIDTLYHNQTELFIDKMLSIDANYYFYNQNGHSYKAIMGIAGISSLIKDDQENYLMRDSSSTITNLERAFGPKVGIGAQYALNSNASITLSLNYIKPIEHEYITNIFYTNIGFNIHI